MAARKKARQLKVGNELKKNTKNTKKTWSPERRAAFAKTMLSKRRAAKAAKSPQAVTKPTFLFAGEIQCVGGYYNEMWEAKVDGKLHEGALLQLVREPMNMYDRNAIAVWTADNSYKVGYVEKKVATTLAPVMDLGIKYAARVLRYFDAPRRADIRLYAYKDV